MGYNSKLSVLIGKIAKVAKLVDALDLGSSAARRESSSLSFRTTCSKLKKQAVIVDKQASAQEAFVVSGACKLNFQAMSFKRHKGVL